MENLIQPILSKEPEYGHEKSDVLSFSEFLSLLEEEENYFQDKQTGTSLMITRLRKIFYDKWGWNTQLIRKAAYIKCRYKVKIVTQLPDDKPERGVKKVKHYKDNKYQPKYRLVTYRKNDRVFKNSRAGQVPEIYKNDHQDIFLPEGYQCDLAHTLAGLDAFNNFQVVSPLPPFLFFLHKLFPHADSNVEVTTWLGDIATTAADFLFEYLSKNKTPLSETTEQKYIDINASASDMLGDIDAYVINYLYKDYVSSKGKRLTEILEEYYNKCSTDPSYQKQRFKIFCKEIGLHLNEKENNFSNEEQWLKKYT
ncbi:MAG TPA: hypothetical protein VH396_11545, partial [Chitinophagaceae bacterium]